MMKIDRKLNLAFSVDTDIGTCYVHSKPMPIEVFQANYKVLAATLADTTMDFRIAPAICRLSLLDKAKAMGPDVEEKVRNDLFAELHNLTRVSIVNDGGARVETSLFECVKKGLIDVELINEIESQLIFFMLILYLPPRGDRASYLAATSSYWNWQLTALNSTDWIKSLSMSTTAESIGETAAA